MTQEQRPRSSANKRAARQTRNRPVLVTPGESESSNEQSIQADMPTIEESQAEVEQQNVPVAPTKRRLPNFFSSIGKSAEPAAQEKDAAQVRVARATAKVASTKGGKATTEEKQTQSTKPEAKAPAKTSASARPSGAFKPRYLIGMMIYLLGASLIGQYERAFLVSQHLDSNLFSFFGGQVTTSTLVFLATLVVLLVILVRLDLIPRSFSAMSGQNSAQARRNQASSRETSEGGKTPPPTMRQGVKGADDDLYQEYRANQRREKKK